MVALCLLVLGLLAIGWFADALVDGALALAGRLRISEAAAGTTILAFGTSAPELAVNLLAAATGSNGLITSNIIGSNVFNTLVVLGVCAVMGPLAVRRWELGAGILATVGYLLLAWDGFTLRDGLLFLVGFGVFVRRALADGDDDQPDAPAGVAWFFVGMVGLPMAAAAVVQGATGVAASLGVPDRLIGFTAVAFGTSLPEFVASVQAMRRGHAGLAVGNVLGSNLFNLLLVLGLSAVIVPLPTFRPSAVALAVALILLAVRGRIGRVAGIVMVATYVALLLTIP